MGSLRMLFVSLALSQTLLIAVAADDGDDLQAPTQLPMCKRISACGASLSTFPTIDNSAASSGWTSGAVPVYDEVLTLQNDVFDFTVQPEMNKFNLCACPNNATCDFDSEANAVKLDHHLTLRFCNGADLSTQCKRNVPQVRVIGPAHMSGDSVEAVSNAAVFCKCPNGFARTPFEHWGGNQIMLNYKCL